MRSNEGRASDLHDAFDLSFAMGTRLAFAVIDLKIMLKIAERAIGATVIAQSRTARLDCILEHSLDGIDQFFGAFIRVAVSTGNRGGDPFRGQPRAEQRFTDINIAEAGNDTLIAQGGLKRSLLARANSASIAASNSFPSGSGPNARSNGSCSSLARGTSFIEPNGADR